MNKSYKKKTRSCKRRSNRRKTQKHSKKHGGFWPFTNNNTNQPTVPTGNANKSQPDAQEKPKYSFIDNIKNMFKSKPVNQPPNSGVPSDNMNNNPLLSDSKAPPVGQEQPPVGQEQPSTVAPAIGGVITHTKSKKSHSSSKKRSSKKQ